MVSNMYFKIMTYISNATGEDRFAKQLTEPSLTAHLLVTKILTLISDKDTHTY